MTPQVASGLYLGKQPETVSDAGSPLHETCWIWKPTPTEEIWILYRGPPGTFPYVDPGAGEPDVWVRIEHVGDAETLADATAFVAWVLDRLLRQGRPGAPTDLEVRSHAVA